MKTRRETVLFYMVNDKIYLYRTVARKENIIEVDTGLFFSFGEISDVEECQKCLTEIQTKMNFNAIYLKPNFIVLYNDVSHSDLKFLYKEVLKVFDYNEVKFVPISAVATKIRNDENLVVFDKNYYTLIVRREKCMTDDFDFEPVFIGKKDREHIHYSDADIIWKKFKEVGDFDRIVA